MNIKLISFDLDGTFLDDNKNIPPENLRAIELAAAKGVHIVPATGRTYTGLPETLRAIPFIRYFITANGAHVYDAWEDKVISRAEIPLSLAMRFYAYADKLPVIYDCYKLSCGYMTESMWNRCEEFIKNPAMLKHVKAMRRPVPELKQYHFWLALYTDRMTFPYKVRMWQYTNQGRVPGIQGDVDINLFFEY